MDQIHSNAWGLTIVVSFRGIHYFATFVYDYLRKLQVYLMKNNNEVLCTFLKWKKMAEIQTSRRVKRLRLDNGGEYKNDLFLQVCLDECDTSLLEMYHNRIGWQNA